MTVSIINWVTEQSFLESTTSPQAVPIKLLYLKDCYYLPSSSKCQLSLYRTHTSLGYSICLDLYCTSSCESVWLYHILTQMDTFSSNSQRLQVYFYSLLSSVLRSKITHIWELKHIVTPNTYAYTCTYTKHVIYAVLSTCNTSYLKATETDPLEKGEGFC